MTALCLTTDSLQTPVHLVGTHFTSNMKPYPPRVNLKVRTGKIIHEQLHDYEDRYYEEFEYLSYDFCIYDVKEHDPATTGALDIWINLIRLHNEGKIDSEMREGLIRLSYGDRDDIFMVQQILENYEEHDS